MAKFSERSGMILLLFCLSTSPNGTAATPLKGTIKDGQYFAPDQRFSFSLPPSGTVDEKTRVIPVSHFYQRAFYPVPSGVEIPRKSEWLVVSFVDRRGLSNQIHSMPISGDGFSPLSPLLHQRTTRRFLQDLALPFLRSSVSSESWLGDGEYLKVDGMESLKTYLFVPGKDVKSNWRPGENHHLPFGTLTFVKDNHIYMLVQSFANYRLQKPEFFDPSGSLEELYRAITFRPNLNLGGTAIALGRNAR